ncbi:MAG: oxidoreductase, partial [Paracoccaceae bacterium]
LEVIGVNEGTLKATAINDYAVEIPLEDAVDGGPILAYLSNGVPMSVREKGPIWIVYPYDSDPKYQTEVIYSRSIWQLDRLETIE